MSTNPLTEPVLLLNINFEPINVCSTRRALSLVWDGKAEIILNGRGVIRSSSAEHELPSIIKLIYMVKRPRTQVALTKREVLRRDDYTCQYCGRRSAILTLDHIMPRHLGGPHTWQNLVAACASCNRRKGGVRQNRPIWPCVANLLNQAHPPITVSAAICHSGKSGSLSWPVGKQAGISPAGLTHFAAPAQQYSLNPGQSNLPLHSPCSCRRVRARHTDR